MKISFLNLMVLAFILSGCAAGNCRQRTAVKTPPPETFSDDKAAADGNPAPATGKTVWIYKYDGSLQCGKGKPIALEAMAKELNGIKIISQQKKPDGLMHIQVCGSPTGMTNAYEIATADLFKAEAKGFKKWGFEP